MPEVTTAEVQSWLEWAGARLIAMPEPRIGPSNPHVLWPDYSQDQREISDFRGKLTLRAMAPTRDEVALVDRILGLPSVCELPNTRRIIQVRSLVHPINYRHLYSWARIARLMHTSTYSVKRMHAIGLDQIVKRTNGRVLQEIHEFMTR